MPTRVRRIPCGHRGQVRYGTAVVCSHGTRTRVVTSTAALAPHVWLFTDGGQGAPHLNRAQAQALVDRLGAWLEDTR